MFWNWMKSFPKLKEIHNSRHVIMSFWYWTLSLSRNLSWKWTKKNWFQGNLFLISKKSFHNFKEIWLALPASLITRMCLNEIFSIKNGQNLFLISRKFFPNFKEIFSDFKEIRLALPAPLITGFVQQPWLAPPLTSSFHSLLLLQEKLF